MCCCAPWKILHKFSATGVLLWSVAPSFLRFPPGTGAMRIWLIGGRLIAQVTGYAEGSYGVWLVEVDTSTGEIGLRKQVDAYRAIVYDGTYLYGCNAQVVHRISVTTFEVLEIGYWRDGTWTTPTIALDGYLIGYYGPSSPVNYSAFDTSTMLGVTFSAPTIIYELDAYLCVDGAFAQGIWRRWEIGTISGYGQSPLDQVPGWEVPSFRRVSGLPVVAGGYVFAVAPVGTPPGGTPVFRGTQITRVPVSDGTHTPEVIYQANAAGPWRSLPYPSPQMVSASEERLAIASSGTSTHVFGESFAPNPEQEFAIAVMDLDGAMIWVLPAWPVSSIDYKPRTYTECLVMDPGNHIVYAGTSPVSTLALEVE